jgi:glycosyltransferase involved in cell wall biosynthesis
VIRLGVDAWNIPGDGRGIGRYVRALLHSWDAHSHDRVAITLVVPEWPPWLATQKYRRATGGRAYALRSRKSVARAHLDLLWFPFNGSSWQPDFAGPQVATLHDASTFVLPGFDDDARASFLSATRHCNHFLTDSDFSATELIRELHMPHDMITAVPLGVSPPRPVESPAIDPAQFGRFVLYVGGTEPRTNLGTVFAAMRILTQRDPSLQFVQIGPQTFPLPAHDGVRVTQLGYVDEATLAAFYRSCAAFVYASAYEGFGLPILEAMAYGAPVVAANSSSLDEAGGDAAIYVAPDDVAGFAAALARIFDESQLAATMAQRGRERAATMTWDRTAALTLDVFEQVIAEART